MPDVCCWVRLGAAVCCDVGWVCCWARSVAFCCCCWRRASFAMRSCSSSVGVVEVVDACGGMADLAVEPGTDNSGALMGDEDGSWLGALVDSSSILRLIFSAMGTSGRRVIHASYPPPHGVKEKISYPAKIRFAWNDSRALILVMNQWCSPSLRADDREQWRTPWVEV